MITNRIVGHEPEYPLDQIMFNPANWRIHPAGQQSALEGVLDEVGWVQNVIINKQTGHLIDGHLRCQLAARKGEKTIPVIFVDIPIEQEELILATLDPIAAMANTDKQQLQSLMEGIQTESAKVNDLLKGIADKEHVQFGELQEAPEPQIDKAEELRVKWGVEIGQLWQLGEHRIICGDCTDKAVVDKVMGREKAVLFATDPPYGVSYGDLIQPDLNRTKDWGRLQNDELHEEQFQEWLTRCFIVWKDYLMPNAAWYIWHAQKTQGYFTAAAAAAAVIYHRQIVWVKPRLILGRGHFHWRHELCLYGWQKGNEPDFYAGHDKTTVWEFGRDDGNYMHPTQKPVECFSLPMEYSTKTNAICAEPFAGSGTQYMAGEMLGRRVYGCEIEPKFVAVTIQRWVDMTGGEPRLLE